MRDDGGRERGTFRGSALSILAVGAALGLAFLVVRRFWERPAAGTPPAPPAPAAAALSAASAEELLRALNGRLEGSDLLKLMVREASAHPVTVEGRVLPAYREEFRLPECWDLPALEGLLRPAAQAKGAGCSLGQDGLLFQFGGWTAVELVFRRPSAPRICLIIDDGGYQRGEALRHLYDLKVPVTVAIIPDVEFSAALAREFPSHGVEVMCHMPMEGHEKGAVGGDYREILRKGMEGGEARDKVEKALEGLPHCRGLNNHMGSLATTDPELIWEVCRVLKARGLYIVDSRTTAGSVVEQVARKASLFAARRDVFLDNVETPEAITKQLGELVRLARKKGSAVGIGHFKSVTLRTLERSIPALREQGIQFVFASEIVK